MNTNDLTCTMPDNALRIEHTCPEWISVKDALPDHGKSVLVWGCNPAGFKEFHVTIGALIGNVWLIMAIRGVTEAHMIQGRVTHWQPIPKGPHHG